MLSRFPRKTLVATALALACAVPAMHAQWPEYKEKKLPGQRQGEHGRAAAADG